MYVVAGVTGQTGAAVAEELLARGKPVRVIVRDEARAGRWKERGAEVAVANLSDGAAVTRALAGTEGAYFLIPPQYGAEDLLEAQKPVVDAIARAVRESRVPHVVLRTFSKAYGLAGLRVGYAVCSDSRIARMLSAAKTPFNVNSAAQLAAVAALRDDAWMRDAVRRIVAERERVLLEMRRRHICVAKSLANFVFFDSGRNSAEVARARQDFAARLLRVVGLVALPVHH